MNAGTIALFFSLSALLAGCVGKGEKGDAVKPAPLSCTELAGTYSAGFETDCDETSYTGTISGTIATDCTLNFTSDKGVSITGTLEEKSGGNNVRGTFHASYCGSGTLFCSIDDGKIRCRYNFRDGSTGIAY